MRLEDFVAGLARDRELLAQPAHLLPVRQSGDELRVRPSGTHRQSKQRGSLRRGLCPLLSIADKVVADMTISTRLTQSGHPLHPSRREEAFGIWGNLTLNRRIR